jgi:hypothetical protein
MINHPRCKDSRSETGKRASEVFNGDRHQKKRLIVRSYNEYEQIYKRRQGRKDGRVTQQDVAPRLAAAISTLGHGAWGYHELISTRRSKTANSGIVRSFSRSGKKVSRFQILWSSSIGAADPQGKSQTVNQKGMGANPSLLHVLQLRRWTRQGRARRRPSNLNPLRSRW